MLQYSTVQKSYIAQPETRQIYSILSAISVLLVVATVVFPKLDLVLAKSFYIENGEFVGEHAGAALLFRNVFRLVYLVSCMASVSGLIWTWNNRSSWLRLTMVQWLFLAVCLATGPGIVANLTFKDHWGRARPRQVTEFGGDKQFSPAIVPTRECSQNCSFVCGESSSMFALFFAGACVWRRRFKALVIGGIAAGGVAGLVRMSQGAHFFSDVVFSGVFMAMTVIAVHWLFETIAQQARLQNQLPADGPNFDVSFDLHRGPAE